MLRRRLAAHLALLALLLAACATPPPAGSSFTIAATPDTVATLADETLQISVTVTGTTGGAVILSIADLAPGMSVPTAVTLPDGTASGSVELEVGPSAAVGTSTVTVTAVGPDASATADVEVTVDPTPGSIDSSYGTDGRVDFPNSIDGERIRDIAIDSGGKAVVLFSFYNGENNDFGVARILRDGTFDPTFGTDGWVAYDGGADRYEFPEGLAIDSAGRIVVVGQGQTAASVNDDFLIMRLDGSGDLDAAFGTGGFAIADFGGSERADGVAIDGSDRIVVVGSEDCCGDNDLHVARLDASGALDATFDGDGLATFDLDGGSFDDPAAVAIDTSDRIVVVGDISETTPSRDAFVVRLATDGSLDGTFNGGTPLIVDGGGTDDNLNDVALDGFDRIVAVGYAGGGNGNEDTLAIRVDSAGDLDTGFGGSGVVTTDITGAYDELSAVAIAADGDIVAVGTTFVGRGGDEGFVLRYDSDGRLDSDFNKDGIFIHPSPLPSDYESLAIDGDGNYLIGGRNIDTLLTRIDPTP